MSVAARRRAPYSRCVTSLQRTRAAHRTAVRALRPARVALILEVEYRRARRDLRREREELRAHASQ
jgi:hypothetical protein